MQFAFVNNLKAFPEKGLKGICPSCGSPVVAKCGSIKVHHWAHESRKDCDTWSEPETEWHREWKNKFPTDWQEIQLQDPISLEWHRADVKTPSGVTLEFQNSPIGVEEIASRNNFYKKIVWVVNGLKFKEWIEFTVNIPNPLLPVFDEIDFVGSYHLQFGRKDDLEHGMFELLSLRSLQLQDMVYDLTYWQFIWKHRHKAWFSCSAPVFIDLGKEFLYWIKKRNQLSKDFLYFKTIKKSDFLAKYGKSDILT